MKITSIKIFLMVSFCRVFDAFSAAVPPVPVGKKPPPPPGLAIDEGLYAVFILGLLYGISILYRHSTQQKTPI